MSEIKSWLEASCWTCKVDCLFPTSTDTLLHLHTVLSLHVSKQGDRLAAKRLCLLMGKATVLLVLQHTNGKLILPGAWVFQKDCKKSYVQAIRHASVMLAVHNLAFTALATCLVEWLHSFLLAVCTQDMLQKLHVAALTEALQAVLHSWHWIHAQNLLQ